MKQTTDLRKKAIDWWMSINGTNEQFRIGSKHFPYIKKTGLTGEDIEQIYLKETSISNDSLENGVKAIHWGETITVTNHKDFTCFINPFGNNDAGIPSSEDRQAAKLICEAVNNYNALKNENEQLKQALQMFHDAFIHKDGEIVKNKVKTDIIRRCDEMKDALNNSRQLLTYGAKQL